MRLRHILPLAAFLSLASAAHAADSFYYDGFKYEAAINGLREGRFSATVAGTERYYDFDKIQIITLAAFPKFNDAEIARPTDPKKAAALYKEAIKGINNAPLKLLAEYRGIDPADADGKWVDAITCFLDCYQSAPTDAVWKARPVHMPATGSTMLKESAEKIEAVAKSIKSDEAKKNLRTFELDIYTKAGDTETAQRLAHELQTGITEDITKPKVIDPAALAAAEFAEVDAAIRANNFDAAIKRADALLGISTSDAAIQLFALKSRAYEGQEKLDLAAAELLRIVAHYPSSPSAPSALLQSAALEKKANHPAEAKILLQEIIDHYPDSPEAARAKLQ